MCVATYVSIRQTIRRRPVANTKDRNHLCMVAVLPTPADAVHFYRSKVKKSLLAAKQYQQHLEFMKL